MASVEQGMAARHAAEAPALAAGLVRANTLTVGLRSSSAAPMVVESRDAVGGLDVELGCSLADELGLGVAFVRVSDAAQALGATCDVVMDVSATETGGLEVVGDYADAAIALFHRGAEEVVSAAQLENCAIGMQDGSAARDVLHTTALLVREATFDTLNAAFDALAAGEVDYVLCHASSGAYLAAGYGGISFAGTLDVPTAQGMAVAAGEGTATSAALRDAYGRLEANGVLAETRRRWLGTLPVLGPAQQVADIPQPAEPAPEVTYEAEDVVLSAQDGSAAGANAVVLSLTN